MNFGEYLESLTPRKQVNESQMTLQDLIDNFRKVFQPYVQMQFEAMKIKFYILNKTRAEQSIGNYLFGVKYNPAKGSIAETSRFHWRASDIQRLQDALGQFVDKKELLLQSVIAGLQLGDLSVQSG